MTSTAWLVTCLAVFVATLLASRFWLRQQLWRRLAETEEQEAEEEGEEALLRRLAIEPLANRSWLAVWLYRAGFRGPLAVPFFLTTTAVAVAFAVLMLWVVIGQGWIDLAREALLSIPAGVGNVMVPFALAAPWLVAVVIGLIPTLIVRSIRRQRVAAIEVDLPLFLDLLNALSQAGIGFDAALARILSVQSDDRPLVQEFRSFQSDALAGRSRIESLRRLMTAVSLPVFTSFLSALIQAEQSGAGLAATLQSQAKEIRQRRRERATLAAMAIPNKLAFPLVIGFLPGIFVVLLGPMFTDAFQMIEQTMRGPSGP